MAIDRYGSMEGQVVLVTGATRGIGERIAARLAGEGATVYAGARSPDDVTADDRRVVKLDVTDDGTLRRAVERIGSEADRLDVLVNNAGVAGPEAPLSEVDVAAVDSTLAVNLRGPVVLTTYAPPLLLERPRRRRRHPGRRPARPVRSPGCRWRLPRGSSRRR
jgi:hypothetical protein